MALEQLSIVCVRREWVGSYQRLVMVGREDASRCSLKYSVHAKAPLLAKNARNGAPGREMRHPSLPF
jgi:hypothetical protein